MTGTRPTQRFLVIHDWGEHPCGKPAYEDVAIHFGGAVWTFDGHQTLDGSQPAYYDPLICAGCGEDTGLKFAPTSEAVRAATANGGTYPRNDEAFAAQHREQRGPISLL